MKNFTKVGVGIIVRNEKDQILIGKRLGEFPFFSIPGGHLELGETFEEAAIRELYEETNLKIKNPRVIAVTNNLQSYQSTGKHYISVILHVDSFEGQLLNKEPDKCVSWFWTNPLNLPEPHFDASKKAIDCYLRNCFYAQE